MIKKLPKRIAVVNAFGAVGYMMLVTSWAFFAAIVIALVFDASARLNPGVTMIKESVSAPAEPSMVVTVASYALAAVVLVMTVVIFVTLPYFIGKWGAKIVRRLMSALHIDMTLTQMFLVKGLLVTVPLIFLMAINWIYMPESVTFAAMYVATVATSAITIGLFFVQLLLAKRLGVAPNNAW